MNSIAYSATTFSYGYQSHNEELQLFLELRRAKKLEFRESTPRDNTHTGGSLTHIGFEIYFYFIKQKHEIFYVHSKV